MPEQLIRVDLSRIKATVLSALPASADKKRIIKGIGAAAAHYWKKLAQAQLTSSSRDYIQGIEHTEQGGSAIISLNGQLPNMIEQGWDGGDMRQWMLSSAKAKQGAKGPYLVIPFRHGTPGTSGRNVGNVMPGPIHQAAKKMLATISRPGKPVSTAGGQTTVYGQRLHPGLPMKAAARKILERKEQPWHATSIYMGMIRKAQPTKAGMQTSGFQTFRTISLHTRDQKRHWVHPGIKARNIARQVEKHIEQLATHIVRSATR